jgi:hypothetical protein
MRRDTKLRHPVFLDRLVSKPLVMSPSLNPTSSSLTAPPSRLSTLVLPLCPNLQHDLLYSGQHRCLGCSSFLLGSQRLIACWFDHTGLIKSYVGEECTSADRS